MNKKKKSLYALFSTVVLLAIVIVLGIFGGVRMNELLDKVYSEESQVNPFLNTLILVISMYIVFMISIIVHEAGHLVFGLMSGYKFSSFRIASLIILKDEGQFKLKKLKIAGTGGQCLMCPPDYKDGKIPVMLYNFGGTIFNFIATLIFFILYKLLLNTPLISLIMLIGAMLNLIFALANGIPMRSTVDNDGYNAFALRKNKEAMRAFWMQLKVNELNSKGIRLKDMPRELFNMPTDEQMQNNMVAAGAVFCFNRLMDECDFEKSYEVANHLLTSENAISPLHRNLVICDKIFLELVYRKQKTEISDLLTPELKRFMKSMKKFPSILRTEYAIALLYENNKEKANIIKAEFEKIAKTYPYQNDIISERELLDYIDNQI